MSDCPHAHCYVVRVKDGVVTFRRLWTHRNRNVVAVWCDRCGVLIDDVVARHYPRARVIEDLRDGT